MLQNNRQHFRSRIYASVDCLSDNVKWLDGSEAESSKIMSDFGSCDDMSTVGWYSLAGYLNVKFLGGGKFSFDIALTLLRPKRKYYFVMDEANVQLAYFKDETDFIRKRQPSGNIELKNCSVTISESKPRAFILHAIGGREYELEAESDQCALAWLHCLQNRGAETTNSLNHPWSSSASSHSLPYNSADSYQTNQFSARSSSVSFFFGDSKTMSTSSLPISDTDMAEALDSALKCCVDRTHSLNADYNQQQQQTKKPFTSNEIINRSGFYIDKSSVKNDGSGGLLMVNGGVGKMNEENDEQEEGEEEEEDDGSELSENARSLQTWIKDWLRDQARGQMENGDVSPVRDEPINNENNLKTDETKINPVTNGKQILTPEQELQLFRTKERRHKMQIQQLNIRIKDLQRQLEQTQRYVHQAPELHVKFLQHQNKFLNAEILRLSTRWQGEQGQFVKLTSKITTLTNDLDKFKVDYVSLLQSCVRVSLGERHREGTEVKLYGGDTHKIRIHYLVDEARQTDPSLPVLENLTSGSGHVDIYGFRHFFSNENLAIHYMSTQLHQHYLTQTSYQNRHRWKLHLNRVRRGLSNTKETRSLMRAGVPPPYRSSIWRCLVHQKIADLKLHHGKYYYKNLCSSHGNSQDLENNSLNQKQITLDLMRTMPNNVHFANSTCKGVGISQLQQVLHAFCIHNSTIGYCQGMNFLAAVCLLFLSPEDTFWFLISLTERYFLPSYFDQTLTGVQADQEVLKWLVEQKLPALAHHLQLCDIDLATITLNWFLALFFDSLPFETMLRVWDCFLLEGPKVLFRFALALLSMHQDALMERSDTMSILKVLKIATKFTYDIEGLTKIAFEGLKPFPRRQDLLGRQTTYINILKEKLRQKEEFRAVALGACTPLNGLMQIGVAISLPIEGHCLLTFGHQNNGRIGVIQNGSTLLRIFDVQFNCRILNVVVSGKILFVSLISGYLAAIKVDCDLMQTKNLWEVRLADMALQLHLIDDCRLLAALANGSLAVLENCTSGVPNVLELYYIPVGPAPITCITSDGDGQLWCGMGCKVFVFNEHTLDCIEKLVVANSINGNCAAIFDRLVDFKNSDRGMWLAVANSSLLQLWDTHHFTCKLLYDISKDCAGAHKKSDDTIEAHITSLLNCRDTVWVGTANGYLLMYQIHENRSSTALKLSKNSPCGSLRSSFRSKEAAKRTRSPLTTHSKEAPPIDKDYQPSKLPLTNRDSGYSTSSSNNGVSCVRRLSQSFPTFDFALLAKRWQSCESLTPPGQKRTQIMPVEHEAIDETVPLDSLPKLTPNNTRLQKRYSKASANKPFNETLTRRRKSVGAISQPFVISPDQESAPVPPIRRQRSNSVMMSSVQSPSLEFDDLFFLYDDEKSSEKSGGLCTSRLNNTDSDWNINETVLFPWRDMSPMDERSFAAEKYVNLAMKRPSSLELRRKDLHPDDVFSVEKLDNPLTGDEMAEQNLLSPTANYFASSETASVISCNSIESPFIYSLSLSMRLKISDKPVHNLTLCGVETDKQNIISCAGSFGDNESILIWSPEENKMIWTNEPAQIETPGRQKSNKLQTRRKTLAWFRS